MRNLIALKRKALGMTQEELASILKISRPYLSDLENGKYNVSGKLMLKIANALGCKVEEIFFDDTVNHAEQKPKAG
ncbi:putative transcriptional regulator [Carboxydocella sporoproducens DSM 16521]|uniref:Putative transcriptional regulator n=2 Tax=Carboxydocella TaxID=178898 RepID=A0A1T4QDI0_9FIRM|nr:MULTISPECIES: helix-turn-helix transcriptional regulator [Carboxydocella]AVX21638.1 putative transcriptional regulator [Carboxydocella thermautotrophica]AVX31846.1 putative transcriptional regulator [Carboxydocella thermautotrophica]SKA01591.1 putative transcriptional regulator [Carboxydocella sporoproducens DSM 16521]